MHPFSLEECRILRFQKAKIRQFIWKKKKTTANGIRQTDMFGFLKQEYCFNPRNSQSKLFLLHWHFSSLRAIQASVLIYLDKNTPLAWLFCIPNKKSFISYCWLHWKLPKHKAVPRGFGSSIGMKQKKKKKHSILRPTKLITKIIIDISPAMDLWMSRLQLFFNVQTFVVSAHYFVRLSFVPLWTKKETVPVILISLCLEYHGTVLPFNPSANQNWNIFFLDLHINHQQCFQSKFTHLRVTAGLRWECYHDLSFYIHHRIWVV